MREIILKKRYPHSREEDITDAFMRGYEKGKADRPQGEWIWKERHINRNYSVKGTDSMGEPAEVYVHEDRIEKRNYCSECGKLGDDIWLNYCPNCGAKMDGEREGE